MFDFKKILKDKGLQASQQRIKILEILEKHRIHPTADDIYKLLLPEMPSLSKTTVYNTLKILTEKGILKPISLFENELRYEYNPIPHAHFKCVECGKVFDITDQFSFRDHEIIDGNKVLEQHINLKGICAECLDKEENNA